MNFTGQAAVPPRAGGGARVTPTSRRQPSSPMTVQRRCPRPRGTSRQNRRVGQGWRKRTNERSGSSQGGGAKKRGGGKRLEVSWRCEPAGPRSWRCDQRAATLAAARLRNSLEQAEGRVRFLGPSNSSCARGL